jgi:hypothetical protein
LAGLVALVLSCGPRGARASTPERRAEAFRLVWSSSAGCGSGRAFLAELASRTALLRQARADEHAITLIVETFPVAGGVKGQLTVRKPDGDLTVREVPGLNCREVEAAMALIAALMVDPLAASSDRLSSRQGPPPVRPPQPIVRSPSWGLIAEQRLTARTALAPGLSWGQAVGIMLTRESGLRPSAGLSAHIAQSTTAATPNGRAELEWAAAQLSLCPLGVQPDESWDLRVCGAFQLGRLQGHGVQTASPATKSILWSSAAVQLESRYRVFGPLWIGLEGAFTMPFSRERFYLEPQQTLHRVPAAGVGFGFGLGLRFF